LKTSVVYTNCQVVNSDLFVVAMHLSITTYRITWVSIAFYLLLQTEYFLFLDQVYVKISCPKM